MQRTILKRTGGIAALALTMSLGLAACGSDSDTEADAGSDASSSEATSEAPSEDASESAEPAADPENFGAGCAGVPAQGEGSVDGMADDPVGTAASNNPLLKTLTAAVTEAGLVQTLNGLENATVFAPSDDAFAKIPEADLNALLADKDALTNVLLHHVVPEDRLLPSDLAGDHDTAAEDTVTVEGEGEDFTIPEGMGGESTVVCGNVQTANANVYVVDTVLMPEGM